MPCFSPFFSVIIPVYNRSDLFIRALDSVNNQKFRDFELIVIDDGSEEEFKQFYKKKSKEYNFELICIDHQGASAARNYGIKKSKGKYISFLDSDDEWHKTKLLEQYDYLSINPEVKVCYTNEKWFLKGKFINQGKKHHKTSGMIFDLALPLCIISPSTIAIENTVFNDIGYFNENMEVGEDYDLWLRLTNSYQVHFIDKFLINKYGGHSDQLSRKYETIENFRITALENFIEWPLAAPENQKKALKTIVKKIKIFVQGAEKRKNVKILKIYEEKLKKYNKLLIAIKKS